ncbi:thioredoxin [Nitzschia inconspicua]|uniref:Thioredoxin n=1 Tax=Nitzschia inconspicua TaxID=303405 RepID=A0A9K3P8Y0_9STRA|nr:thioredoxin [Nitzschia inconspicua]KAG7370054.1 thioredoxin [Nitzschia inconspicua]
MICVNSALPLMLMISSLLMALSTTEAFSMLPFKKNNISSSETSSWVLSTKQSRNRSFDLFATALPDAPSSSPPSITIHPVTDDQVIGTRPKIVSIESAEDYLNFLKEGENDPEERLAVVKFYADWCKSCQKFGQQFTRIGREIGDLEEVILNQDDDEEASIVRKGEIRMGEIEWSGNSDLCKALGVTKLPAVHIYSSKGRLVDAFRCGPNKFPLFLDKLDNYLSMDSAELDFEADMVEGSRLSESVMDALSREMLSNNDVVTTAIPFAGASL